MELDNFIQKRFGDRKDISCLFVYKVAVFSVLLFFVISKIFYSKKISIKTVYGITFSYAFPPYVNLRTSYNAREAMKFVEFVEKAMAKREV